MRTLRNEFSNGMGDLMPGTFIVPQNPITAAQKAANTAGVGLVRYVPRVGEIVAGSWTVPQNPIRDAGRRAVGTGNALTAGMAAIGCGCGCGGSCGCGSGDGLGEINLEGVFGTLNQPSAFGLPLYVILGAGLVAANFLFSRGPEYEVARRNLRRQYSTRAGRAKRYVGGALDAGSAAYLQARGYR